MLRTVNSVRNVLVAALLAAGLASPALAQPVLPGSGQGGPEMPGGPGDPGGGPVSPPPVSPPPPPPPPPPPEDVPQIGLAEPMWVAVQGQPTGPFEPPVIATMIMRREIVGETLVYTGSMNRWVRAADVAPLQPLLAKAAEAARRGPTGMPGVPQPGEREQEKRFIQFMLGEWMTEGPVPQMPGVTMRMQLRYHPDGTFRGFTTITMRFPGSPPSTHNAPLEGNWQVRALEERRFMLTMSTAASPPVNTPLEIMDTNTVRNIEDGSIATRIAH